MKRFLLCVSLIPAFFCSSAQLKYADSLQQELSAAKNDTTKALVYGLLSHYYSFNQLDSCVYYAQKAVRFSQKANYKYGEALGFYRMANWLDRQGNYAKALEMAFKCLRVAEQLKYWKLYMMSRAYHEIGLLYRLTGDYQPAIINLKYSIELGEQSGRENELLSTCFSHIAQTYLMLNQLDSALFFAKKGYNLVSPYKQLRPVSLIALGNVYEGLNNYQLAEKYYREAIQTSEQYNSLFFLVRSNYCLGRLFSKLDRIDTCIYYGKESLTLALTRKFHLGAMDASSLLTKAYEAKNNTDSTLRYVKTMLAVKDSVFGQAKMQQFQLIAFDEEQRKQQLKTAEERYQNQIRIYTLMTVLAIFLLLAFVLYRNNKQKKKANLLLRQQKEKVEQTLAELKSTQSQLIQSEKMASLGELTAGIAHEIQNPLNFVNNFSEVNKELLAEMREEMKKGNYNEVNALAKDVEDNQEKINHHGKRADAIVKGMLQHSRSSSGVKEPTDINALADEYLRLAYHGLRAKEKSFTAKFETDLDKTIEKINVVPQDIGRVILNLINNAFYAVTEKKKLHPNGYEPTVTVSTRKLGDKIELRVIDNGNGIPQKVLDKIFQPFFTTKPTSEGTGLGLSLSYDIVKAHGGELKVETKENEGAEFIIQMPAQ